MTEDELINEHKYIVDIIYRKYFSASGVNEQDLKQEGLLALLKAARTYQENQGAKFETYASTVIRNRMIDVVRKEKTDRVIAIQDGDACVNTSPEQIFWGKEKGREIKQILKTKCNKTELAIYKSFYLGRSYSEIAFTFGIQKKKVDNTIQKVKKIISSDICAD